MVTETQKATREIKQRIDGIQLSTNETTTEVGDITELIDNVNEIIAKIAESMVEQANRAADTVLNIEQASLGISEVNENVAQASHVASQIAQDISEVSLITQSMFDASKSMRGNSGELSDLANKLRKMIGVFKVSADQCATPPHKGL